MRLKRSPHGRPRATGQGDDWRPGARDSAPGRSHGEIPAGVVTTVSAPSRRAPTALAPGGRFPQPADPPGRRLRRGTMLLLRERQSSGVSGSKTGGEVAFSLYLCNNRRQRSEMDVKPHRLRSSRCDLLHRTGSPHVRVRECWDALRRWPGRFQVPDPQEWPPMRRAGSGAGLAPCEIPCPRAGD